MLIPKYSVYTNTAMLCYICQDCTASSFFGAETIFTAPV